MQIRSHSQVPGGPYLLQGEVGWEGAPFHTGQDPKLFLVRHPRWSALPLSPHFWASSPSSHSPKTTEGAPSFRASTPRPRSMCVRSSRPPSSPSRQAGLADPRGAGATVCPFRSGADAAPLGPCPADCELQSCTEPLRRPATPRASVLPASVRSGGYHPTFPDGVT